MFFYKINFLINFIFENKLILTWESSMPGSWILVSDASEGWKKNQIRYKAENF